jgi:hypothetical protein
MFTGDLSEFPQARKLGDPPGFYPVRWAGRRRSGPVVSLGPDPPETGDGTLACVIRGDREVWPFVGV